MVLLLVSQTGHIECRCCACPVQFLGNNNLAIDRRADDRWGRKNIEWKPHTGVDRPPNKGCRKPRMQAASNRSAWISFISWRPILAAAEMMITVRYHYGDTESFCITFKLAIFSPKYPWTFQTHGDPNPSTMLTLVTSKSDALECYLCIINFMLSSLEYRVTDLSICHLEQQCWMNR